LLNGVYSYKKGEVPNTGILGESLGAKGESGGEGGSPINPAEVSRMVVKNW